MKSLIHLIVDLFPEILVSGEIKQGGGREDRKAGRGLSRETEDEEGRQEKAGN